MKKSTLIFVLVWMSIIALAQTPQAFKYQTVARNNAGEILASQNISFRMTILQDALPGTVVYAETHAATTNTSGLVTLEIGKGTVVSGNFSAINWGTTPIFLKTEIDPAGGSAYVVMGTSELLSVPYALYAKTAGNGFSGNYNDLTNKPALWDSTWLTIKNKPTTVAGYEISDAMTTTHPANGITSGYISNWNTAFGWGNHATAGYLTSFSEVDPIWTAASSNYYTKTNLQTSGAAALHFNNLTNKPTTVAGYGITDAMTTAHAANLITSGNITNWNTAFGWGNHAVAGYLTSFSETDPIWISASGNYYTKTNLQTSGAAALHFNNLTNKPTTIAGYGITDAMTTSHAANGITSGNITNWNTAFGWGNHTGLYRPISYVPAWNEVTGKPIFATVATSGSYNDLINKPAGINPGDMLYWNGTAWVNIPASVTNGQALIFCNGAPQWGPCLDFATLTTTEVTSITGYTAVSGGNVTNNGGSTVTERGVCLATTIEPDIYDITFACTGGGTGSFTANLSGLTPSTTYYIRAYATNTSGTAYGNELEFTTLSVPTVTTTDVTSITPFTAVSGGNVTDDGGSAVSRGVCYGTSVYPTISNYTLACGTGTGSYISILQNLTPLTVYYVRAYATNNGGTAYGNQVDFITPAWTCGEPVTVVHDITEGVAPVNKTVSYGTVTNIPGENTKCWITSNLGADNQATAVSDDTEASAGWYWQFNRKQGYKYATNRVPNTTWISSISENSDWIAANDPCALEMASDWRIPTYTEWANVDASGSWNTWTGPWNSGMKLHAAGLLNSSDGLLGSRGSIGRYWSSAQNGTTNGFDLYISSGETFITYNNKAFGYTLRCLKE
jgi:hypothetical protein